MHNYVFKWEDLFIYLFVLSINLFPRFHSLVIDVTMALDTLSLPVLEPLTPGRLLDMTVLALSCLYAGKLLGFGYTYLRYYKPTQIYWAHTITIG